jgi:hypothetical protein
MIKKTRTAGTDCETQSPFGRWACSEHWSEDGGETVHVALGGERLLCAAWTDERSGTEFYRRPADLLNADDNEAEIMSLARKPIDPAVIQSLAESLVGDIQEVESL